MLMWHDCDVLFMLIDMPLWSNCTAYGFYSLRRLHLLSTWTLLVILLYSWHWHCTKGSEGGISIRKSRLVIIVQVYLGICCFMYLVRYLSSFVIFYIKCYHIMHYLVSLVSFIGRSGTTIILILIIISITACIILTTMIATIILVLLSWIATEYRDYFICYIWLLKKFRRNLDLIDDNI